MPELPVYASARTPLAPSFRPLLLDGMAPFPERVWQLHRVIVSPASSREAIRSAKQRLLGELGNELC